MRLEIFYRACNDQVIPLLKNWAIAAAAGSLVLTGTGWVLLRPETPPGWQVVFTSLQQITGFETMPVTPAGWFSAAGFHLLLPILLGFFSIGVGSRLIAWGEENGDMELLLAYPLSRSRILIEKYAALPVGQIVLAAVVWVSLFVFSLGVGFRLPAATLALACLNSSLLALVFGTIAFTLAAASGSARRSRWITAACALLLYLFYRIPALLPQIAFLKHFSPFTYSLPPSTTGSLAAGSPWVSLALIGFLLALSWKVFRSRDLGF